MVIVGSDKVIPFRRVVDQTTVGNERYYSNDSGLKPDTQLFASLSAGNILTDDYYVDEQPIAYNGTSLYLPDVAISRLVETPADIVTEITTFLSPERRGKLASSSALVAGYDFMADGATRVQEILNGAGLSVDPLINDNWTGQQLKDRLAGASADVAGIAGHFTHFAGISAAGYLSSISQDPSWGPEELLTSKEIADATVAGAPMFAGRLVFSMGCHAGLNVPDSDSLTTGADNTSSIDPRLDFAQATMSQGGVFLGSTGYGYGESDGIGETEALLVALAKNLVAGGDVGQALAQAKREFIGSQSAVTPYDQKSSIEFVLYGMPQYRLTVAGVGARAGSVVPAGGLIAAESTAVPSTGAGALASAGTSSLQSASARAPSR